MAHLTGNEGLDGVGAPGRRNISNPLKQFLRKLRVEKSTKALISEARKTPDFGIINTLHSYLYARWPYFWIGLGTGEHRWVRPANTLVNLVFNALMRFPADRPRVDETGLHLQKGRSWIPTRKATFSDTYHGKVMRLDAARHLVSLNEPVNLRNLETVIPYSLARDIILDKPGQILVLDCPCRAVRSNPCLPLDVCLVFGEPFVSFVTEHHPRRSRLIDRQEAIDILVAEAERGHSHHAFFKEAAFGRFFAICNCCSCCCGAMQFHRNGIPMLASSGFVSVVDEEKCVACGACVDICPFGATRLADQYVQIDKQTCMGCGVCTGICPENALSLVRDHTRSDPLLLDQLLE